MNFKSRDSFFDVVKMISIFFVIFTHVEWLQNVEDESIPFFPFVIDMAVPMFMIVTGYMTFRSCKNLRFSKMFEGKRFINKLVRYLLPYLIIFLVELVAVCIISKGDVSFLQIFIQFLRGGRGPGGYYIPVLIQCLVLLPILVWIMRKYKGTGLAICFILNLVYEILKTVLGISLNLYRVLAFRYIFLLALGMWLFQIERQNVDKKRLILLITSFLIGVCYIILICLRLNTKLLIFNYWQSTTMMCGLYIFPIIFLFRKLSFGLFSKHKFIVGMASYHIFLLQKLWFLFFQDVIKVPAGWFFVLSMLVCLPLGLGFYLVSTPIEKKVSVFLQKKFIRE